MECADGSIRQDHDRRHHRQSIGEWANDGGVNADDHREQSTVCGQIEDGETGTFYNYFRDYQAQTGRYSQSDPIGLGGGISAYGYGFQNPFNFVDPFGLYEEAIFRGGYIVGWKPGEPPTLPPSKPIKPVGPGWGGHVDLPTGVPKDPINYPAKTPLDEFRPRDNLCFALCLDVGVLDTLRKDLIIDLSGEGVEAAAAGVGLNGVKAAVKKAVPWVSAASFVSGVAKVPDVCNQACR